MRYGRLEQALKRDSLQQQCSNQKLLAAICKLRMSMQQFRNSITNSMQRHYIKTGYSYPVSKPCNECMMQLLVADIPILQLQARTPETLGFDSESGTPARTLRALGDISVQENSRRSCNMYNNAAPLR